MYTEITEMIAFKNTINQLLLIALSLSGMIILTIAIGTSVKLKRIIKKLTDYATEIGYGKFDAKVEKLKYTEFQMLATSMNDMSNMLATYEANQKKFFQNASHELRTPLMVIQCYSEGILSHVFEPDEAAIIMTDEIEKMNELISSILYLSRLGNHTPSLKPTNVNDFLTKYHQQTKMLAERQRLTIRFTPLDSDVQIKIDERLFERALSNILTNAIRYAEKEIHITLAQSAFNKLSIHLINDGKRVDEKDLPYLFERFYKSEDGNTGLGLAITKEIIIRFNGHVTVENLEKAVCFTIELPIYLAN